MRLGVLVLVLVSACTIHDDLVPCGEILCPRGLLCTPGGCARPEAVAACDGKEDGEACAGGAVEAGTCVGGACQPASCGNGIVDQGEICDDGNQLHGDGCSADCASIEVCGNDVVDLVRNEECDQGTPGVSSDGCTSVCTRETELWRSPAHVMRPPAMGVAMAYDEDRDVIVAFGGSEDGFYSDQTWEWDGVGWRRLLPPTAPPERADAALAYDPIRKRVVLFGGIAPFPTNLLADTWEWDGIRWTERMPTVSPPPRGFAAMASDPDRGVIVLFGGGEFSKFLDDTWEWDGTTWTARTLSPSPSPAPRHHAAFAYDPVAKTLVLFGGESTAVPRFDDTWTLDADGWEEHTSLGPPARSGATLVSTNTGVLLFGGAIVGGTTVADVWARTGTAWSVLATPTSPPPRTRHRMIRDTTRDRYIMFGGISSVLHGDTWELSNGEWTDRTSTPPTRRRDHALVYDKRRGVTVLFGGSDSFGRLADLWEWDGTTWLRRMPPAPMPGVRLGVAHTYDERRGRVVLFGGEATATSLRSDVWEWDGTAWVALSPTPRPRARVWGAMAFDAARGVSVLFGGFDDDDSLQDTWLWDGTTWTQVMLDVKPPPRESSAMAYDPVRERVVLYGGYPSRDDTWEWDGTQWLDVSPPEGEPRPRAGHGNAMAYDPLRRRMMLLSSLPTSVAPQTWEWDGTRWEKRYPAVMPSLRSADTIAYDLIRREAVIYSGSTTLADTWLHRFDAGRELAETCRLATDDLDGDGLAGCDDPDCFGRCAPLCVPGAACDPALPHCGDATCDPVEDYLICPSDCP